MTQPSPGPAPKARVLSNMYLPAAEGYSIRCFGEYLAPHSASESSETARSPAAPEWRAEMERRNLSDILPLIPASEKPDILVCASPEYLPIPWDIHTFPGPKVLLITDWNVCLRFLPDLCPLFDYCFTDWPGYRLLRKAGVENVFHQALFGHDPARFRFLGKPRDLDLSFCGNLNSGLHRDRNRLLARVARWGHRTGRPIHLRQAFDAGYIDVLNRSRLVFNYAIRAEANMRLFEAMACGAVPLVEETNQEVGILFQEGRHYFRFAPGRLEDRLDELLSQPERIAEVAVEAQKAVMRQTKSRQIEEMLDTVMRESPCRSARSLGVGSPASRNALARIRVLGAGFSAQEAMQEIQTRTGECPGIDLEAIPALLITLMENSQGSFHEPVRRALAHLLGNPALPAFIRIFLQMREALRAKAWETALGLARECQAALPESRPEGKAVYSFLIPPINLGQGMNSDLNQACLEDMKSGQWNAGLALLRTHCLFTAAESLLALGRPKECLDLVVGLPAGKYASLPVYRLLAESYMLSADHPGLKAVYRAWFESSPLDTGIWEKIAEGLKVIGDGPGRLELLRDLHVLARFFLTPGQADSIQGLIQRESGV